MVYYLGSIAIILFEIICCKIFFESFCKKNEAQKQWKKVLLMTLLVVGSFFCALFLSQWLIAKQIAVLLVISIVMCIYFKISILKSIAFSILFQGLVLLIDYIAYAINGTLFSSDSIIQKEYQMAGSLVVVLAKILLFLCVLMIKNQFGKKTTEILTDTEWIRFLFCPIFTIIIIIAMTMAFQYVENQEQANVLYTVAIGMVGMNVFVYYLINSIITREAELHKNKLYEMEVKNQTQMYRSISENFERQKKKTHEFKNHILCIEGLLKEQHYTELNKYVQDISNKLNSERNAINTNNVIVNSIINTKHQEAINKKIVFVCKVNDLSEVQMEDEDIVVLLSNLLNNAIEACEKCNENRVIKLKFIKEDENIVLAVKNTYEQPIIYENDEIKTTKVLMPEEHGVGIKNIIKIVEKYNGSYVIKNDSQEFFFSILIPV